MKKFLVIVAALAVLVIVITCIHLSQDVVCIDPKPGANLRDAQFGCKTDVQRFIGGIIN